MRKLILAYVLPKVIAFLSRRVSGRPGRRSY
jgi:hypothetical protein